MEGEASYRELVNPTFGFSQANFNFLGLRTVANTTDLNYRATGAVTLFAGYHFSTRRVRSTEQVTFEGTPESFSAEQDNTLSAGRAGIRIRGFRGLSLILDGEIGRADNPVYPISERNYHALSGRLQYKSRPFTASLSTRTNYNTNSI